MLGGEVKGRFREKHSLPQRCRDCSTIESQNPQLRADAWLLCFWVPPQQASIRSLASALPSLDNNLLMVKDATNHQPLATMRWMARKAPGESTVEHCLLLLAACTWRQPKERTDRDRRIFLRRPDFPLIALLLSRGKCSVIPWAVTISPRSAPCSPSSFPLPREINQVKKKRQAYRQTDRAQSADKSHKLPADCQLPRAPPLNEMKLTFGRSTTKARAHPLIHGARSFNNQQNETKPNQPTTAHSLFPLFNCWSCLLSTIRPATYTAAQLFPRLHRPLLRIYSFPKARQSKITHRKLKSVGSDCARWRILKNENPRNCIRSSLACLPIQRGLS